MSMLNNFVPADLFVYMAGEENINKDMIPKPLMPIIGLLKSMRDGCFCKAVMSRS